MPNILATSAVFSVTGAAPPPPSAVNDTFGPFTGGSTQDLDVLNNDLNLTNSTIVILTQPAAGTVSLPPGTNGTPNAVIRYVLPNPGSQQVYTFNYTVDGSNSAQVSVTVNPVVAAAVAVDDIFGPFTPGTAVDIDVLANDQNLTSRTIANLTTVSPAVGTQPTPINNSSAAAKIHFVCPSPVADTVYTFTYTVDGAAAATVNVSVTGTGAVAGTGIQLPAMSYQTITDAVPGGAIWWNPTSGNDGLSGNSKANAKKSFGAAESLVGAGGTIVVVGGTHNIGSAITPSKSGGSGNYITLRAEPNVMVRFVRDSDFRGAMDRTWTWTLVDSGNHIWESPNLGIGDGATTVTVSNNLASGSNWLVGFIRIPIGARNYPHLMRLPYAAPEDMANPTSGNGSIFNVYGHPIVCSLGNGRIRIRMQIPPVAFAGSDWPKDGIMGPLVNSSGQWAQPATQNPNDYEIHIVRWGGDFGGSNKDLFNFNGRSHWHIKGINAALLNRIGPINSSDDIWFDYCTMYPQWCGNNCSNSTNIKHTHCIYATGDARHMDWTQLKNGGYYFQHFRATPYFGNSNSSITFQDCVLFGWFDGALPVPSDISVTFDHVAMLNNEDDGVQVSTGGRLVVTWRYCYVAGVIGGQEGGSDGGVKWVYHHNVIDHRIPELWAAYNYSSSTVNGVAMNQLFTEHGGSGIKPRNFCYNTVIMSANDRFDQQTTIEPGPGINNQNITSGLVHSVFNNIFCIRSSRRYDNTEAGGVYDQIVAGICCQQSAAGTHRYDYNCYDRTRQAGPFAIPAFRDVMNSNQSGVHAYGSLSDFKNGVGGSHYATSASMYSDGTQGHEQHGVQVDPGFVNLSGLDYRPTHSQVVSGAKNVTSLIGGSFENFKGALNPSGNGREVGPRW